MFLGKLLKGEVFILRHPFSDESRLRMQFHDKCDDCHHKEHSHHLKVLYKAQGSFGA